MAQTLKSKISKLSQAYSIQAIIDIAQELQIEQQDQAAWDNLTTEEKTNWFMDQCAKYNLTTHQYSNQIKVNELPEIGKHGGTKAYFTVFLPRGEKIGSDELSPWHLEIGGAYISDANGGIWSESKGLKGREHQIAQVMRLHNKGE